MNKNDFQRIVIESLTPCAFLAVALCVFQPFGTAYNTLMDYFLHIVLCEVASCFMGSFVSLIVCYYAIGYRFNTKDSTLVQTKKLLAVYLLCIPLTAVFLFFVNDWFLPLQVNKTVPGYPDFTASFLFYCGIVFRYCVIFFAVDVFIYHHRKTKQRLEEVCTINEMLKSYQEELSAESPAQMEVSSNTHVHLGENTTKELALNPMDLIYIESVANYAEVCYFDDVNGGTVHKTSIRATIKQLKEELNDFGYIVQCHRGFLVNLRYVESLEGKDNRFFLNLFCAEKKIPVSRTNKNGIREALSSIQ